MTEEPKPVPEISYYPTGAIRYTGFLLGGASHGPWEFFRLDGSTMRAGSFRKGRQVGIWRTFDRSGRSREGDSVPGRRRSRLTAMPRSRGDPTGARCMLAENVLADVRLIRPRRHIVAGRAIGHGPLNSTRPRQ